MDLDELRLRAAKLFPLAAQAAVARPGQMNIALESLNQLCTENYEQLGYNCQADCFSEVVPKLEGSLSLEAWCSADLEISGWNLNIRFRPFFLGSAFAHFEIRHDGPLPGVTQTGYQSVFTPLANLADQTPFEFLQEAIPQAPREQQMSLF